MFIVSFIICSILTVTAFQPIHGAENATLEKFKGHENVPKNVAFGEGATYHVNNVTKESISTSKVSNNLQKMLMQKTTNATEHPKSIDQANASGAKHRGVTKVGDAPLEIDEHKNKNSTLIENDEKSKSNEISPKVVDLNLNTTDVDTNKNSTTTPVKLEPKPIVDPTGNNQTKVIPKPLVVTTIQPPKKPLVTFSVDDVPGLLKTAEAQPQQTPDIPVEEIRENEPLSLESSETITYSDHKSTQNFIMSIVGILVVVPFIVLVTNCAVRRARDYWSKRRYRRMDYLVEDMYN